MRAISALPVAAILASCSSVPPLEQAEGGVPIKDVVLRVKCELADTFGRKMRDPQFRWMQSWTAKVDLNLQANSSGSLNPGASIIAPLRNAYPTSVGPSNLGGTTFSAVKQQFSFGLGGSYGEQAIRTEIVSFTLSLPELVAWRSDPSTNGACAQQSRELGGDLGLDEWATEALSPVSLAELTAGDHPAPAAAAKAAPVALTIPTSKLVATASPATVARQQIGEIQQAANKVSDSVKKLHDLASQIRRTIASNQAAFDAVLDPTYRAKSDLFLSTSNQVETTVTKLQSDLAAISGQAQKQLPLIKDDAKDGDPVIKLVAKLAAKSISIQAEIEKDLDVVRVNATRAKKRIPNPPLDSITHSVQFLLAYSASATPNWMLLNSNGPTGSLFAASAGRVQTLNISLAPRGADGNSYGPEAARALLNLNILQSRF